MIELVPKTICLPVDLDAYIEKQTGNDFQEKLINLLHDAKETDSERQETIEAYDKQIQHSQRHLDELRHKIYNANEILRRLSSLLSYADRMIEKDKPEEPGN